jgi:hypothetical protein
VGVVSHVISGWSVIGATGGVVSLVHSRLVGGTDLSSLCSSLMESSCNFLVSLIFLLTEATSFILAIPFFTASKTACCSVVRK